MNERIKQLMEQATSKPHRSQGIGGEPTHIYPGTLDKEKFAELIVAKVLDEVATRAYVSGDRSWSDDLDRPWIELEFGYGKLAELKNEKY